MVEQEIKDLYNSHQKYGVCYLKLTSQKKLVQLIFFQVLKVLGKRLFQLKFAQLINCEQQLEFPCNTCASCKRFERLQHENLNIILPLPTPKKSNNPKNFI